LLFLLRVLLLLGFEDVLAVVHDLADDGIRLIRNQHQIHRCCLGGGAGLADRDNTYLLTVSTYQAYAIRLDFVIGQGALALTAILANRLSPLRRPTIGPQ
jgi:hypothetical protein